MMEVVLLIENSCRAGKFLVEIGLVDLAMVNHRHHRWVIDTQVVRSTSYDRAFAEKE